MASNHLSLTIGEGYIAFVDAEAGGKLIKPIHMGLQAGLTDYYQSGSAKIVVEQGKVITHLLSEQQVKKKNCNIIIPDSQTYAQFIEMPKLNEKELLSAIKYQADQFIPLPLEETSLDLEIVEEDKPNKKLRILVVAAPIKVINRIEATAEAAGIIPEAVENELSATARVLSKIAESGRGFPDSLIINFSQTATSIYFFSQQRGLVIQTYNFSIGYNLFLKEVQLNFNLSDEKAKALLQKIGFNSNHSQNLERLLKPVTAELISQIKAALVAAKDRFQLDIKQILVFNQVINILGLEKKIEEELKISTAVFDIYPYLNIDNLTTIKKELLPLFIPAIGGNLR